MVASAAYGERLKELFRLPSAETLLVNRSGRTDVAVTRCRCDTPDHGLTDPIPQEDAFMIGVHVRECPDRDMWLDGRRINAEPLGKDCLVIHDLRRRPNFHARSPFHVLYFHIPQRTLDSIADDTAAPRITDLQHTPGVGREDRVVRDLSQMLLPAFDHRDEVSRLFVDNLTLALCGHVAETYGGLRPNSRLARGGLTPWQERRAKDILDANLAGDISIAHLAHECGLSKSYFSRSFRQTTGLAPHQWLLHRRIEAAKTMLLNADLSLSEIGLACGFGDQSHFTRVFTRMIGVSPGAWRKRHPEWARRQSN
jgi:AraC family transcriptional regulator